MKPTWLSALLLVACAEGLVAQQRATLRFSAAILHIQSDSGLVRLRAELALTDEQQALGLQGRDQLASDAGMLFRLRDPIAANTPAITMYRTRIPLDIAFLDRAGTILDIKMMEPCTLENRSACPRYASAATFHGVLEVNRGFFARYGIRVGHKVVQASQKEHTSDSIRVVMNDGLVSLVFTLHRAPDVLTGFLDHRSDVRVRDSTGVSRPSRRVLRATAWPKPLSDR